jgi:hypothetical protein
MTILAGCTEREESHEKEMPKETTSPIVAPVVSVEQSGTTQAPVKEFTMESYTNVVSGAYHPRFSIGQMNVIK